MVKEIRIRSLVKAVTYRAITIMADLVIVYILTRRLDLTVGVTIFTNVASTAIYYGHERVWNKIGWGHKK